MTLDLGGALRRWKPDKRLRQLRPRPADELLSPADAPAARIPLLLDTNVYIADAAGRLPSAAEALVDRALLFHSSVCLSELAVGIANGDPRHRQWSRIRDHYVDVIEAIPPTRILVPDRETWVDAGILAGILARLQGLQPFQRKDVLNDALIFLTASRHGLPVLTSNRDEFDYLEQLAPGGLVYHY